MFQKVLIANRGAIACRMIRTLRRMGIRSVAVYSEADAHSLHVAQADEAVCLGPAAAADSYLRVDRILDAARSTGAEAIHPGYGFLSENADFAESCEQAGIVFIGPTPGQMREFGLKHTARAIAAENNAPLLPGTGLLSGEDHAVDEADRIGYPVMLKSTAGGGGIGMRLCRDEDSLRAAYEAVERLSRANFKESGLFLEKFIEQARHIEVQIFGDGKGQVVALGERDCSVQRRNQKVIEETPAPGVTPEVRAHLLETAMRLGQAVNYRSAGTVEFVYDAAESQFYFLEVNTRLQVEHGVTEEVTGVDLVEWMVRLAAGENPIRPTEARGSSIQVRLYAEDPGKNFQPSAGLLTHVHFPEGARTETWVEAGSEITPYYDPLIAKIIVKGDDREHAVAKLSAALADTRIAGLESNLDLLREVAASETFREGAVTTRFLDAFAYRPSTFEILEPGTMTTVQDYPGRLGYWNVGVPPSGPMDSLAFRLGNRIVGNAETAPGLECTLNGPTIRFHHATTIAITGADMRPTLDGIAVPLWQPVAVKAGAILELQAAEGPGARTYLAVAGGIDVPQYLGSASTFTLGRFGGHGGRALRSGDVLHIGKLQNEPSPLSQADIPQYSNEWTIGVLYGPHGAPDFFTDADIDMLFATGWRVHYNSSRTGVRLIGPKPHWARKDGGEAGLHPSNIHDNAYAVGTIDFTGDMPIILGPDGPSLGGFVCPATIIESELWKIGQLRAGDTVRFHRVSTEPAVLDAKPGRVCRASGDRYLLLEYGDAVLDLNLRFRVHALMEQIEAERPAGIIDLTPGIRSLQIHYDSRLLPREKLLDLLDRADAKIPDLNDLVVPTRIVHLPLSWDDPATQLAIQKYVQGVRPDAPWCPSNIEFIRRINGLDSIEDVHRIVFDASYLVLGLGDVYLGAPVATPVDPRHRLVTTKYNPARTWTPENAVGIGGAYLCVYGMEGPGGYQFVGRTVQMWNTYKSTPDFEPGSPWLLRFFDQIRFYAVEAGELLEMRDRFPQGKLKLDIEHQEFRLRDYNVFLASIRDDAAKFKSRQQAAFEAERERWAAAGQLEPAEEPEAPPPTESTIPPGCAPLRSPTTASVWRLEIKAGDRVEAGQRLLVLEAMKMEIAVVAQKAGIIVEVLCKQGTQVMAGQQLLVYKPEAV